MSEYPIGAKIDAIQEEYESYDFTRYDAINALVHLGLTVKQAKQLFKSWHKEQQ